jgi:hypothetical protein
MDDFGTQDIENELFGSMNPSGTSDAELLKHALLNEKASPDVLAYDNDLITRIESHIDYQVCYLQSNHSITTPLQPHYPY